MKVHIQTLCALPFLYYFYLTYTTKTNKVIIYAFINFRPYLETLLSKIVLRYVKQVAYYAVIKFSSGARQFNFFEVILLILHFFVLLV